LFPLVNWGERKGCDRGCCRGLWLVSVVSIEGGCCCVEG
jgi:hypothetical protein